MLQQQDMHRPTPGDLEHPRGSGVQTRPPNHLRSPPCWLLTPSAATNTIPNIGASTVRDTKRQEDEGDEVKTDYSLMNASKKTTGV